MSSGLPTARRLVLESLEDRRLLASDFFLEIDGVKGESTDSDFKGAIEVDSFSWGAASPSRGSPTDATQLQDFHFVKKLDKATPELLKAAATGEHIKKAVLFVRKSGGTQVEYLKYEMTDILVSSLQRQSLNEELPLEEISLNFTKIDQTYCPTDPRGTACVASGWDVSTAKMVVGSSLLEERVSPNVDETDAFLKITGIPGDSTESKHKDEIHIESFSWGMNHSAHNSGGGGGAGKVQFQDFHFVMQASKASPLLAQSVATGQHIKQAQLTVRRQLDGEQFEFLTFDMEDILITSYEAHGDSHSAPMEEVTFHFTRATESVSSLNSDGTQTTVSTDIDANAVDAENVPGTSILDQTVPPPEANEMFLEIEGIKGESIDSKHKETIEILSYSWGVSQTGSFGTGGGGGAGKVSMQDFNFVSQASKATPLLMKSAATGQHIKKAELFVRKSGGKTEDYLEIKLRDTLITSYQLQSVNEQAPLDQFTLNFSKIEFEYKPQNSTAPVKVDWKVPDTAEHVTKTTPVYALPAPGSTAAHDFFLEIDGIKGESDDLNFKGSIELDSFSWGVSQANTASGGGAGAGKASFYDIHFVSQVSKASPLLWQSCATGKHIAKAVLSLRQKGSNAEYLSFTLENTLISSYQVQGIDNAQPMEEVAFNFAKMEIKYTSASSGGRTKFIESSLTVDDNDTRERGPSILEATHVPSESHDYLLEIAGIKGESSSNFQHQVQVDSFSWGVSQSSHAGGGGGGAGKVQMQDIHFVTNVNPASPDLIAALAQGDNQIKALLQVRPRDPNEIDRFVFKLQDSIVSSYRTKGTERSTPQEEVSLNFAAIEQKFEFDPRLLPVAASWRFDPDSPPDYHEGASILDDTAPDAQAHDIFLEIEGVKGESTDDSHLGSIELASFSWGMSQSISSADRSIGRPKFEDFTFEAHDSTAAVELMGLVAQGQHIAKATLFVRKAGGKQEDYMIVRLSNATITSYQTQGTNGVTTSNSYSFSPGQIEFEFLPAGSTRDAGTRSANIDLLLADLNDLLDSA